VLACAVSRASRQLTIGKSTAILSAGPARRDLRAERLAFWATGLRCSCSGTSPPSRSFGTGLIGDPRMRLDAAIGAGLLASSGRGWSTGSIASRWCPALRSR
jgi:hypothetical protein